MSLFKRKELTHETPIVIPPNTPLGDLDAVKRLSVHMLRPGITTERRRQIRLKIERILYPSRPDRLAPLKRRIAERLRYWAYLLDGGQDDS